MTTEPTTGTTARRFERLLVRIIGVFGALYAVQTMDSYLADRASVSDVGDVVLPALVVAALLAGLAAAVAPGAARPLFTSAFLLYAAALVVWPFTIIGRAPTSPMPWLVAMSPVAVAYLVIAMRDSRVPFVAQILMSALVAVDLLLAGGVSPAEALLNAAFVTVVAKVLIVVLSSVRRSVARAETAQEAALDRYAGSRLHDALEAERVRTDALVHDSVLMTFLAAANAHDAGTESLAERNAQHALDVIARLGDPSSHGPAVPLAQALAAAEPALAPLLGHVDLRTREAEHLVLPEAVATALVGAMTEAMALSVRRTGPRAVRTAVAEPWGADGIRIVVADDGPDAGTTGALGAHASILERVRQVGGTAQVASAPGGGTRVTLAFGALRLPDDVSASPAREHGGVPVGA